MAEKIPYVELCCRLGKCPKAGSFWRHYKSGHIYRVLDRAIQEATKEPLVIYIDMDDPYSCRMARPLSEWEEEVWHDGQPMKRFVPIPEKITIA